jgi:spore maturation protein CgeB
MWYPKDFVHHGWGGEDEIRGEVLNNYLASAKIIVGDSVPTPYYWSNRIYEILGRGGFLIHPKVEGLDKEFKPYKHYVPYERGNWSQLKEIIDYYLVHDEERKKIQMAGFRYCKKHYTYTKRVAELLKQI